MNATIITVPGARYPHQPICACGEHFRGYVTEHAAQLVADAHRCRDNVRDVLAARTNAVVKLVDGPLIKAWGSWSKERAAQAEAIDPAEDFEAWRSAMGTHEECTLTADGRMVDRGRWCSCGSSGEAEPVRYEFWTAAGRKAHGWACFSCRGVTQTG